MATGSDIECGTLTYLLVGALDARPGCRARYGGEVHALERDHDGHWTVTYRVHGDAGSTGGVRARFVLSGPEARPPTPLEASGIPEARGYGGFPVSDIWLRCDKPEVVNRHKVKVDSGRMMLARDTKSGRSSKR